jgi:hypothetical protein
MADSNRTQIAYVQESTWGVTPGSPPTMKELRFTGESLNKNIQTIISDEIRSDRQIIDLIKTSQENAGAINFELSYATYDDFFLSALYASAWSTPLTTSATTISASSVDNSINRASGSFITDGVVAGTFIKTAGFATAANNGFARVVSVTALKIVLSGITLVTESAGATVTLKNSYIRNGVTEKSLTLEKGFVDIAQYISYTGMVVSKMSLGFNSQNKVTGSFDLMGKEAVIASSPLNSTLVAANTNEIYNSVDNVSGVFEGGTIVGSPNFVNQFTVDVVNNTRTKYAVGSASPIDLGVGKVDVTGTLKTYFGDAALYTKFINGTRTSLTIRLTDSANNTYIIDMPQVEYSEGDVPIPGNDQDIFATLGYRALRDPSYGFTIQICKF